MSGRAVMLLDLDGVILDNDLYDSEWVRLAGHALTPVFGGEPRVWGRTSEDVWQRLSRDGFRALAEQAPAERVHAREWWNDINALWIAETCRELGVEAPDAPAERREVAEQVLDHFFSRTRSIVADVSPAIAQLAAHFDLHMASGNPSRIIETVLRRLGVRAHVGQPFGSDLLGVHKHFEGEFYRAILDALGAPARWVVVDDLDDPLRAARDLGAVTVKVGRPSAVDHDLVIGSLAELPAHIEQLRLDR